MNIIIDITGVLILHITFHLLLHFISVDLSQSLLKIPQEINK